MSEQPVAVITTFRDRAFVKREEAAAMLNISPKLFDQLVSEGKVCRPHRFSPKTRRWRVDDLLKSVDRMQDEPLT